jgi:hypothetical protein
MKGVVGTGQSGRQHKDGCGQRTHGEFQCGSAFT